MRSSRFVVAALCAASFLALPVHAAVFLYNGNGSGTYTDAGGHSFTGKAASAVDAMRELNLTVFGDMSAAHDVEGKAFIGGNASGNFTSGVLTTGNKQSAKPSTRALLTVGGNLGSVNVSNATVVGVPAATNPAVVVGGDATYIGTNGIGYGGAGPSILVGGRAGGISIGAGEAASIFVGKDASNINFNSGSTVKVKGTLTGNLNVGANTTVEVGKNLAGGINTSGSGGANVTVAGNIVGQNSNINGNGAGLIRVGGSSAGRADANVNGETILFGGGYAGGNQNNGGVVKTNQTLNLTGTASFQVPDIATSTSQMYADAKTLSAALAALPSASSRAPIYVAATTTMPAHLIYPDGSAVDKNAVTFTGLDFSHDYAVINITAGQSFFDSALNAKMLFSLPTDAAGNLLTTIINVSGQSDGIYRLNQIGAATGTSTTALNQALIWNFIDAKQITTTDIFHGSILAPDAQLRNSTPIEGSAVVGSFIQGGEIHLGTFNGSSAIANPFQASVPETSSWAMMIVGFGAIGGAMRRRRRVPATT